MIAITIDIVITIIMFFINNIILVINMLSGAFRVLRPQLKPLMF